MISILALGTHVLGRSDIAYKGSFLKGALLIIGMDLVTFAASFAAGAL